MWEKRQQEPTKTNYPNRLVSDPPVSKCRQRYVDRGPVASRRATVGIQDSDKGKGGTANRKLAYGSPGHAIPDACSRQINRFGHVWKCRISAFMLAWSNTARE
ncbi:hypothetical protein T06_4419 [Trichinella sp. T6]|nr:hypothetical protein T06_4419 [Trichinella sp. T6]